MRYKKKKIYNFLDDILVSFIFFTVLPLLKFRSNNEKPNYTRSQWAFPLVGIFIGLVIVFIVKFSLFLGLNLVIASTLGVLFNIYILGFLENRQASNFSKKQNSDNLRTESTETKNQLFLIFLIFLKIHLIAELFIVEGFTFIITGCYALGTFSIVLFRKIFYSYTDENFSIMIGKSSNKNLLLSTSIVLLTIFPLGLLISSILLFAVYFTAFVFNIFLASFGNNKNKKPLGIYTQIIEIISLIILNFWFII